MSSEVTNGLDPNDLSWIRQELARRIAEGADWLLPWYLKVEAAERDLLQGQSELERVRAIGKALTSRETETVVIGFATAQRGARGDHKAIF